MSGLQEALVDQLKKLIPKGEVTRTAKRAGLTMEFLLKLRKGAHTDVKLSTLQSLASAVGVSPQHLISAPTSSSARNSTHEDSGQAYEHLPLVGWAAAGEPRLDAADGTQRYAFSRSTLQKWCRGKSPDKDRLCLVRVTKGHHGESMLPTIRPGAVIVVDRGPRGEGLSSVEDGKIYLVRPPGDEGGLAVKRVFKERRTIILSSDNRDVRPFTVDMKGRSLKDVLVGRVVWIGQEEP